MRSKAVSWSLLALCAMTVEWGVAAPAEVVKTSGKVSVDKARVGSEFKVAVVAELSSGWHLYSEKTQEPYIATQLKLTAPKGFTVGKVLFPKSKMMKLAGENVDVFEGTVAVGATVKTAASVKPGKYNIEAELKYQACNDKLCLRPTSAKIVIPIAVVASNAKSKETNADVFGKPPFKSAWLPPASPRVAMIMPPLYAGGVIEAIGHRAEQIGDTVRTSLSKGSVSPLIILLLYVGGIFSAFSPCVIPVIPMTVAYFGHQSRQAGGKTKALLLALSYVAGITALYSTIGMTAVLVGKSLSFLLQGPTLWLVMVVLFAAMGLSMFGLFEIPVPQFVARKAGARTGFAGAFIMGLVAGVLFMPCAGPVVGGLATGLAAFAQTASTPRAIQTSLTAFTIYCLGLGSPFLVLAMLSGSALSKAPKGGEWAVSLKKLFGMVFLGMSLYFMQNVPHVLLMGAFLLGCGVYLACFEKGLGVKPATKTLRWASAMVVAGVGLTIGRAGLATPPPTGGDNRNPAATANGDEAKEIQWSSFSDDKLAAAKKSSKPVVMFFTADW